MSSNNVPVYASGLSNDNTINETSKHKGSHKLSPKKSDSIPVHEISDVKSPKKRKSTDNIMDTTPIRKMSEPIAKTMANKRYNRCYSKKKETGEAHIHTKKKYDNKMKKDTNC